jgi:hypothetical protein
VSKYDLILIGNGHSARDYECGKEIDEIPKIVRFNKYYLDKWSKYVGSRTTHWVTYWGHEKERKGYDEILSTCRASKKRFARFKKVYPIAKLFPEEVFSRTIEEMGHPYPTKGALAVTYFVHFKNFKNIAIYGFDHFSRERHHYAGNRGFVGHHSPEHEESFFNKYIKNGHITRFKP